MKGVFLYSLNDGCFQSCSLKHLHSSNAQTFLNAIKILLKSQSFMDNLGKHLVIMAQDRAYHDLIHKKDLVYIKKDQLDSYEQRENDYLITFSDGLKGRIEIDDNGSWMIDTPIVFLILLWIFIDHCTSPEQQTNAKLAIVDCMMIKSQMIYQFIPEFLDFIQRRMFFSPKAFTPLYIHHLSYLASMNQRNIKIMSFYENEKKCFKFQPLFDSFQARRINLNDIQEIDLEQTKISMSPSELISIIQLMIGL